MSKLVPRLSQEELHPDVASMLRPRVERLGYLGEFFRCAGHQPQALISFMKFTDNLKHALPDNLTEVVALTVATLMQNAYERVQHERLALKLGYGEKWIREVLALQDNPESLCEQERLVQGLVIAVVHRSGRNTTLELEAVIRCIGHLQAVAVLMLVGRYVTHALFVNCLDLAPPVASPLADTK